MALRYIGQFFDIERFLKGKVLLVTSVAPNKDFNTVEHIGTKVEVSFYKDETPYDFPEGTQATNRFEKVIVKLNKDVNEKCDDFIELVSPKAKLWHKRGTDGKIISTDNLSITADDVRVMQAKPRVQ